MILKTVGVFLAAAAVFLIEGRFWKTKDKKWKNIIIGSILIVVAIGFYAEYSYIIENPQVQVYEGEFVSKNSQKYSGQWEYCFTDGVGLKPVFDARPSDLKRIWPDEFREDVWYRIYYEERTKTIVKVELMEE